MMILQKKPFRLFIGLDIFVPSCGLFLLKPLYFERYVPQIQKVGFLAGNGKYKVE